MALRVLGHRTVYRDDRYYCGPGPTVVRDGDEGLLVGFRRVPSWLDYGHSGHWHPATESCLTRSMDGGRTWSLPRVFLGGNQCPNLTRLSDGALIHSTHRMELVPAEIADGCGEVSGVRRTPWTGVHSGTCIWRSDDNGETWGEPVYLKGVPNLPPIHENLHTPVAVRGNVLELSDGRLLVSAYSLDDPHVAYLFDSTDGGRRWTLVSEIAEGYNEAFLHECVDGTLVIFMRKWGGDISQVHVSRSGDGGRSWSDPVPLCKGYPACAVGLPDGRVFLAYGYRFDDGLGVRARLLTPTCDVEDGPEVVIRDDGAVADLGYPHATLLPDGGIFVVYYINRSVDAPDARAPRYVEACVLTATA